MFKKIIVLFLLLIIIFIPQQIKAATINFDLPPNVQIDLITEENLILNEKDITTNLSLFILIDRKKIGDPFFIFKVDADRDNKNIILNLTEMQVINLEKNIGVKSGGYNIIPFKKMYDNKVHLNDSRLKVYLPSIFQLEGYNNFQIKGIDNNFISLDLEPNFRDGIVVFYDPASDNRNYILGILFALILGVLSSLGVGFLLKTFQIKGKRKLSIIWVYLFMFICFFAFFYLFFSTFRAVF